MVVAEIFNCNKELERGFSWKGQRNDNTVIFLRIIITNYVFFLPFSGLFSQWPENYSFWGWFPRHGMPGQQRFEFMIMPWNGSCNFLALHVVVGDTVASWTGMKRKQLLTFSWTINNGLLILPGCHLSTIDNELHAQLILV